MTAPDAFAAPQKALAERGPSIHDGGDTDNGMPLVQTPHFPTKVARMKSASAEISRLFRLVECGSGGMFLPSSSAERP
jgi:hypothetical protein